MNEEAATVPPPAAEAAGGVQQGLGAAAGAPGQAGAAGPTAEAAAGDGAGGAVPEAGMGLDAAALPLDAVPATGEPVGPVAQLAEWAGLGGPVVWILALMSIVALAVTLLKLFQCLRSGVWRRGRAAQAVAAFRSGDRAGALELVRGRKELASEVVRASLRAGGSPAPAAALREEIEQYAADRLEGLRGGMRLLEAIAALAPLLGLFGTVLGMIEAFQEMQGAGARVSPDILAGGIWTALLTTAVGLAVAMPTVAVVTFFERTLDSLAHDLESFIAQIFTAEEIAGGRRAAAEGSRHAEPSYGVARAV